MTIATTALLGLFLWSPMTSADVALAMPAELPPEPVYPTYSVSMTGYNAVAEQTDGDPLTTASGAYSNPTIVAARSVDLADELPFGTVIEVMSGTTTPACGFDVSKPSIGLRVVADSMHSRMRNKIDIMFPVDEYVRQGGKMRNVARALGMCKGISIRVVGKVDIRRMPKTQQELRLAVGILEKAGEQELAISK